MNLGNLTKRKEKRRSQSPHLPDGATGPVSQAGPSVEPTEQDPNPESEVVEPTNGRSSPAPSSEAMIPSAKFEGLQRLVTTIAQAGNATQGGAGFSMNSLLSMDETQKTMPDVLAYLLGAQEHDMYSILERCRLTPEQHRLYTNGIHLASHGYGWRGEIPDAKGNLLDLDFTIPILGDSIVKKLRGSVSIDGESRHEFERTTSQWTRILYEKQELERQNQQRGIRQ